MRFGDSFCFVFLVKYKNSILIYTYPILYLNLAFRADHVFNLVLRDRGKQICQLNTRMSRYQVPGHPGQHSENLFKRKQKIINQGCIVWPPQVSFPWWFHSFLCFPLCSFLTVVLLIQENITIHQEKSHIFYSVESILRMMLQCSSLLGCLEFLYISYNDCRNVHYNSVLPLPSALFIPSIRA